MSDFGTIISIGKVDNNNFTDDEASAISVALNKIIETGDYEDALGEKYTPEIEIGDNKLTVMIRLSEHYFGEDEEENEATMGFVKDTELPQVEEMAQNLKAIFTGYEFEATVEEW